MYDDGVLALVAFVNPVVLNLSIMYPRGSIPGITYNFKIINSCYDMDA